MKTMFVDTIVVTSFRTNCYLVAAAAPAGSGDPEPCLLIDPGGEADLIIARLRHRGLFPELIVNTHGHGDHIGGNAGLKKRFPETPIAVGQADGKLLGSLIRNMAIFTGQWSKSPPADRLLTDGELLEVAGLRLRVRELPGHTRGHVCLVAEQEHPVAVFCGDTVFAGTIGRTDLPGGSKDELLAGIARVILTLPAETVLYPGHGPSTTVGEERQQNPFLQGLSSSP